MPPNRGYKTRPSTRDAFIKSGKGRGRGNQRPRRTKAEISAINKGWRNPGTRENPAARGSKRKVYNGSARQTYGDGGRSALTRSTDLRRIVFRNRQAHGIRMYAQNQARMAPPFRAGHVPWNKGLKGAALKQEMMRRRGGRGGRPSPRQLPASEVPLPFDEMDLEFEEDEKAREDLDDTLVLEPRIERRGVKADTKIASRSRRLGLKVERFAQSRTKAGTQARARARARQRAART